MSMLALGTVLMDRCLDVVVHRGQVTGQVILVANHDRPTVA